MPPAPGSSEERIDQAVAVLRRGGVVAMPTETVYGLAADALNPLAVARVFEIKGRPKFDPLIVHLAETADLVKWVESVPPAVEKLTRRFWPGPMTVVLAKKPAIPDLVTAGLSSVAVRVPDHTMARELIRKLGRPVAAPSANRFGGVSPTTADHVRQELGDAVDLVLDGGPCKTGIESTVISFMSDQPEVLRPGGVSVEEVESVIGKVRVRTGDRDSSAEGPRLSPGMLSKHYAPRTKVILSDGKGMKPPTAKVGYLGFRNVIGGPWAATEVLSPSGDLREAAANLFAAMRRLDAKGLDLIVAELVPEQGLGRAINDRLRRASSR